MDKPGTRSYIHCTPEAKRIAELEMRVERLEMELKAEEEVGRRKVAELEYRLKHTHKECENCTMTALDTTGLNICDGCGQKIWEGEG